MLDKINVSYVVIKELLTKLPSYYTEHGEGSYTLYAVGDDSIITSLINAESSDVTDFETNYKSSCTLVAYAEDAFVLASVVNNKKFVFPKSSNGIPLTISEPRQGSEVIYATHNFCDKSTWYSTSVRVENQQLTDIGDGYTFTSPDGYWIDMISGRVLDDDGLVEEQIELNPNSPHGYAVIVKVDNIEKTMREPFENSGGDYSVDFENGTILFFESQSGKTVTASYSKANTSIFILRPLPGKQLDIEAAEADFSTDLVMNDAVYYTVFGYAAVFAPQAVADGYLSPLDKVPLVTNKYKRYNQLLREAIGAYPTLQANASNITDRNLSMSDFRKVSRGSKSDCVAIPFRYGTIRTLYASAGMEIQVGLDHNRSFDGETATLTFYCTSKDES
jgi:hypothetical protein